MKREDSTVPQLNMNLAYRISTVPAPMAPLMSTVSMKAMHRFSIIGGTLKLCVPLLLSAGGYWLASWVGRQGYAGDMGASGESVMQTAVAGGGLLLGFWWALTRAKF